MAVEKETEMMDPNLASALLLLAIVAILIVFFPIWDRLFEKTIFPIWDWLEEKLKK